MQKQIKVNLSGQDYIINEFAPTKGLRLLTRLLKLLGTPFAMLIDAGDDEKLAEALPKAMTELLTGCDEDTVVALCKDLMSGVTVNNHVIDDKSFDLVFAGKLGDIFKLSIEVVQVNYAGFLQDLKAAGAQALAKKAQVTQ